MRWAFRTSPPLSGRTRFSCRATSPRRIAYGRWMCCGGWRPANCPRSWARPRWNWTAKRGACGCGASRKSTFATLPAADRVVIAAYARGVNYFIETHRAALPLEFTLLRYDPRPWTIVDSILCGLQMYRELTTTWRDELRKAAMLAGGDRAKVNLLFPARAGAEFQPGSNAWVVSGKLTRQRQADSGERSAPGVVPARRLVSGASQSARPGRDRRIAAGPSVRDYRPQPADRLGRHESWLRCTGPIYREDRSANRPICLSRPGGAGALGIGVDSSEGCAAARVAAVGDAARSGGIFGKRPLFRAALERRRNPTGSRSRFST